MSTAALAAILVLCGCSLLASLIAVIYSSSAHSRISQMTEELRPIVDWSRQRQMEEHDAQRSNYLGMHRQRTAKDTQ